MIGVHARAHLSEGGTSNQPVAWRSADNSLSASLLATLLLYLALLHLNLPAHGGSAAWPEALRNVVVVIVLPALLVVPVIGRGGMPERSAPVAAFLVLFGLCAAGTAWSAYPASGFKQTGYLWSYACQYVLLRWMVVQRRSAAVETALWLGGIGCVLAIVQTFGMGNAFGGNAGRFTSFVAPQSFGLSLAVLYALLLYGARRGGVATPTAVAAGAVLIVAAIANGGRQGFVTMAVMTLLSTVAARPALAARVRLPLMIAAAAAALFVGLQTAGPAPVRTLLAQRNPLALLMLTESGLQETGDAGTLRDRLNIYRALAARIGSASPLQLAAGHGTSAAGIVIAEKDVEYRDYDAETMDPNRTAHNEFLRSLYEWGIGGFAVLSFLLLLPAAWSWSVWRRSRASADLLLLAAAVIVFVGYSMLGNLLAASSGPLGIALVLLFVEIEARRRETSR